MIRPSRLNRNDYDNIYIASDFHYNHQRDFVWKPRGFKSYQEHDRFIENECDKLTNNDLLIYLGDFSLNSTPEQSLALMNRIHAQVFYVFGNHESYHSKVYADAVNQYNVGADKHTRVNIFPLSVMHGTTHNFVGVSYKVNDDLIRCTTYFGEEGYFQIGNMFYFCRHMAPLIWDKMKYENYVCLCGHSHGNSKELNVDNKAGKILDVGMDNAMKYNGSAFFKIEEVDAIMKTKTVKIYDHHGDDNI
jgi:predicted phosphodiesterase